MNKICLASILCLLLFIPNFLQAEQVSLYGFTPASVDSIALFPPGEKPRQEEESVVLRFIAKIDKNGKLKSIKSSNDQNDTYLKYISEYLKNLTYRPAIFDSKKKESLLPIDVVFSKKVNSPIFQFPLVSDTLIYDYELYKQTALLNKQELPQVISFPSYFSVMNVMDSASRYPFILEKVTFEDGKLSNIENVMSTHDAFVGQLESATRFAEFQLPKKKNKNFSGELYLMISFFPQLSYPVGVYKREADYSSDQLFAKSVRIVDRNSYFLSEPLPKRKPSDKLARTAIYNSFNQPIDLFIQIDTMGNAYLIREPTTNKVFNNSFKKLVSKLKFFPAINQSGQLVLFRGFIRLEPINEFNIRISYKWLE